MDKTNKIAEAVAKQMAEYEKNKDKIKLEREQIAQNNPTCLTYWYPKVCNLPGIKTPITKIFPLHFEDQLSLLDGKPSEKLLAVIEEMKTSVKTLGTPFFLKNSVFSGKHNWNNTCKVLDPNELLNHIGSITDFAYSVGCDESLFLVARSWVDTEYSFTAFGGMPVTKERRYFVSNGKVVFHHPYWPPHSIREPSVNNWEPLLQVINQESDEEIALLKSKAELIGSTLGGSWSVDFLQDKHGEWYLIDMAEMNKSFCWKDYPHGKKGLE